MRRFFALTPLLAVLSFAPAAPAQHGSLSMSLLNATSSFRPDLTQRDLRVIIRVLGLQGDSLNALQDLYDGYAGTLASEGAQVREFVATEIERAEIMQNSALITKAQGHVDEWNKRSQQIKKTFLDDLKSLLTRDEEARWPIVERELRRLRYVPAGILSGENVDLVKLTEDAVGENGPTGELAELLNRYSEDLDRALVARKNALDANTDDYQKFVKTDPDKATQCWKAVNETRVAVQAVNDRHARLIAAQLPANQRDKFELAYFERCYPAVCRPTRMDEYMKDAFNLSSLSPDQRTRLEQIRTKYEAKRSLNRQAAAKAWRLYETEYRTNALGNPMRGMVGGPKTQYNGADSPETHPLVIARKERLDLDRDFRKQVDATLTPEQRDEVPSRLTPHARFENWEPDGL